MWFFNHYLYQPHLHVNATQFKPQISLAFGPYNLSCWLSSLSISQISTSDLNDTHFWIFSFPTNPMVGCSMAKPALTLSCMKLELR